MKAVYEMPKVSFEAFMANNAVLACAGKPRSFDCVCHNWKDEMEDFHGDEPENIIANVLGLSGCTNNNAYFADYTGAFGENSTETNTDNFSNLSNDLRNDYNLSYQTKYPNKDGSFLGWLYISLTERNGEVSYNSEGWTRNGKGELSYKGNDSIKHAWLAPLYVWKHKPGFASN